MNSITNVINTNFSHKTVITVSHHPLQQVDLQQLIEIFQLTVPRTSIKEQMRHIRDEALVIKSKVLALKERIDQDGESDELSWEMNHLETAAKKTYHKSVLISGSVTLGSIKPISISRNYKPNTTKSVLIFRGERPNAFQIEFMKDIINCCLVNIITEVSIKQRLRSAKRSTSKKSQPIHRSDSSISVAGGKRLRITGFEESSE